MIRVYPSTDDPVTYILYDLQEAINLFGKDWLEDYGINIPDALLSRYKATYKEFWKIQAEIKELIPTESR